MSKTKVAFLEGRLSSSRSKQFKQYTKSSNWLEKNLALQKATFVLLMQTS